MPRIGIGIDIARRSGAIDWSSYCTPLNITSESDAEEVNYTIPVYVHWKENEGEDSSHNYHAYMNRKCKTDFSDIYFTDEDDNKLDFYLASQGNYELINEKSKRGYQAWINSNGDILSIAANPLESNYRNKLFISTDKGVTWSVVYDFTASGTPRLLWLDSLENIFIGLIDKGLWRSGDGGTTFTRVIDMTAVSGSILPRCITEDNLGNLYCGRYQDDYDVKIYKSTDHGVTWVVCYEETTHQHVHMIGYDPYTGNIYASLDGAPMALIRSVDNGANWTIINAEPHTCSLAMYFGDGFRLFGTGAHEDGAAIIRTTDDSTFTTVLNDSSVVSFINEIGGLLFASCSTNAKQHYPAFVKSEDDGVTWETIEIFPSQSLALLGYQLLHSNKGIIRGETEESIIFCETDNPATYDVVLDRLRLKAGGNHYTAMFYVNIGTLPVLGKIINVRSGGSEVSTLDTFVEPNIPNLLVQYKLDEGTGGTGTVILDYSGNNKHGTLTSTGSWNNYNLRRVGSFHPPIKKSGASFKGTTGSRIQVNGGDVDADFKFAKNFTILLWVGDENAGSSVLVSKANSWAFGYAGINNSMMFTVIIDGISTKYSSSDTDRTIYTLNSGENMVGIIVDNSTPAKIKFVCNGHISTELTLSADIVPVDGSVRPLNSHHGDGDDFRIYNRALTKSEILNIFHCRG